MSGSEGDLAAQARLVLAAVRAAEGADGRLAMPSAETLGDAFPYEGDLRVKPVRDPVLPEPDRPGTTPADCANCNRPDEVFLWVDERWRLVSADLADNLPVVLLLEPRAHVDLGDLDDEHAAELGRLTVAIERAIRADDPAVGRVHVHRWGDGAGHVHLWFIARPAGLLQLRGAALAAWLDVLPALPSSDVQAARRAVAQRLVDSYGGRIP